MLLPNGFEKVDAGRVREVVIGDDTIDVVCAESLKCGRRSRLCQNSERGVLTFEKGRSEVGKLRVVVHVKDPSRSGHRWTFRTRSS